eukprot:TRINITY_DN14019_c0_g1_i1.p1 TRINITY_DN14019_c0_g1~~TRINITY_DN14019_c0_g1_i1.p1  ORF type:complete len:328 (+),score=61.32 TRINITY_DN14019_c0_g1_i1:50-985(+)
MSLNARNQLECILGDETQRDLFLTVLQRLHCAENLLFYVDVLRYRSIQQVSERTTHAYIMWDKFFNEESLSQINVDAETLKSVRENVSGAASTLFDGALAEIMTMLEFDSLPKYLRSEEYKQYQLENAAFLGSTMANESISNPFQGQTSSPRLLRASRGVKKTNSGSTPLKTLNGDQLARSASSPAGSATKKRSKLSKIFSTVDKNDDDSVTKQSPSKKRSREILETAKSFLEDSSPAKRVKRATKLLDFFGVPAAAATEALDELTPRSAAAASSSAPKLAQTPVFNNENSENGGLGAQARRSTYQAPSDW